MDPERLNPRQFERFRDLIYELSGIRVNDNKVYLLSNRIRRRLKAGPWHDFDAYYQFVTSPAGRGEIEHMLDVITTNETFFFRTGAHFEWFAGDFIGEIADETRRGTRPRSLRVWSAGCATGAEPYTIAICLHENRHRLRDFSLSVLGTDISEEALREARDASFRPRAVEQVGEPRLKRCFEPPDGEGRRRLRPELRRMVTFEQHNLMTPLRHPTFDCIFIRNVLIYFDRVSKQAVIANLIRALSPGGYLVVGPSEGIYDMLDLLQRHRPFLYQKPGVGVPS